MASNKKETVETFGLSASIRRRIESLVDLQLTPTTINLLTAEFAAESDETKEKIGMYIAGLLEIQTILLERHFEELKEFNAFGNSKQELILKQRQSNLLRIQQIFAPKSEYKKTKDAFVASQVKEQTKTITNVKAAMTTNGSPFSAADERREALRKQADEKRRKELEAYEAEQKAKMESKNKMSGNKEKLRVLENLKEIERKNAQGRIDKITNSQSEFNRRNAVQEEYIRSMNGNVSIEEDEASVRNALGMAGKTAMDKLQEDLLMLNSGQVIQPTKPKTFFDLDDGTEEMTVEDFFKVDGFDFEEKPKTKQSSNSKSKSTSSNKSVTVNIEKKQSVKEKQIKQINKIKINSDNLKNIDDAKLEKAKQKILSDAEKEKLKIAKEAEKEKAKILRDMEKNAAALEKEKNAREKELEKQKLLLEKEFLKQKLQFEKEMEEQRKALELEKASLEKDRAEFERAAAEEELKIANTEKRSKEEIKRIKEELEKAKQAELQKLAIEDQMLKEKQQALEKEKEELKHKEAKTLADRSADEKIAAEILKVLELKRKLFTKQKAFKAFKNLKEKTRIVFEKDAERLKSEASKAKLLLMQKDKASKVKKLLLTEQKFSQINKVEHEVNIKDQLVEDLINDVATDSIVNDINSITKESPKEILDKQARKTLEDETSRALILKTELFTKQKAYSALKKLKEKTNIKFELEAERMKKSAEEAKKLLMQKDKASKVKQILVKEDEIISSLKNNNDHKINDLKESASLNADAEIGRELMKALDLKQKLFTKQKAYKAFESLKSKTSIKFDKENKRLRRAAEEAKLILSQKEKGINAKNHLLEESELLTKNNSSSIEANKLLNAEIAKQAQLKIVEEAKLKEISKSNETNPNKISRNEFRDKNNSSKDVSDVVRIAEEKANLDKRISELERKQALQIITKDEIHELIEKRNKKITHNSNKINYGKFTLIRTNYQKK